MSKAKIKVEYVPQFMGCAGEWRSHKKTRRVKWALRTMRIDANVGMAVRLIRRTITEEIFK